MKLYSCSELHRLVIINIKIFIIATFSILIVQLDWALGNNGNNTMPVNSETSCVKILFIKKFGQKKSLGLRAHEVVLFFLSCRIFLPRKVPASTPTHCASTAALPLLGGIVCRLCVPPDQSFSRIRLNTAGPDPLSTPITRLRM